jgi:hypothetical protein
LLHSTRVVRTRPAEGAVLVMVTMLIERLALQLAQPGADEADLRDVLGSSMALGQVERGC